VPAAAATNAVAKLDADTVTDTDADRLHPDPDSQRLDEYPG